MNRRLTLSTLLLLLTGTSLAQEAPEQPTPVPLPATPPASQGSVLPEPGTAKSVEDPALPESPARSPRLADVERARNYFTDVVLIDQNGDPQRLYSDLLRDQVVVISPFFTTCAGVCPVLSQKVAAVQQRFRDRLGKDLRLLSISVDPETDDPSKLQTYARRFKAESGWYFLGGEKENVDQALYKLGQYVENKEAHTNIIIIGNEATGLWRKVFGLGPTEKLLQAVQEVLDDHG